MKAKPAASAQYDLVVRNAALAGRPDGNGHRGARRRDRGRRAARRARRGEGRGRARCRGPARHAAVRRRALPHGRDALVRAAARQRVGDAARGHRALGRAEADADRRGDRRAGARLLRLGCGQGPPRHPLACRRLRSAAARRRRARRRARARASVSRPAARRLSAGRPAALERGDRQPRARARQGRGRRRGNPALRAHDGRRCGVGANPLRDRREARAARRHALRRNRRSAIRGTSRRWRTRRIASVSRGASTART